MEQISGAVTDALEHGGAVIIRSRLLLTRCEITRTKSRRLARNFLIQLPLMAARPIRGASEVRDVSENRPRHVSVHRPTANRWIVVTGTSGRRISPVGPFAAAKCDAVLRDYVPLDGHHSLAWFREHIEDFAR
jgi:hypothetical protein